MTKKNPTSTAPKSHNHEERGSGDELHQRAHGGAPVLTSNQGVAVSDDQNSLKAGPRGPTLLEDFLLREKITHFDHERIPERVVHARGYGAHGVFRPYRSHKELTRAAFLQDPAEETPVFVRFSTVAGSAGSADTVRDVRGFAVKFYTSEGIYDLVGNNIPVFFIQDAIKFPDMVHSVKPEPDRDFPQAQSAHDTFWDFVSLTPESMHMLLWVMSDRAIPRSFRTMEGFGVHTFRFVNADGVARFVKFHWRPLAGSFSLIWDEALKLCGADPDFHRRDLWEAIERGQFPEYELSVQVFDEAQAQKLDFDVLDPTKIIPEEIVPLTPLGKMTLNRNVDSFFAETEQVAFCPSHVVPGIDFSNDPLLQGRVFSYLDTQLSRLGGPNFHEIPINKPKCPWHNLQRGGHMRTTREHGRVAYEPQSLAKDVPLESPTTGFRSHPEDIVGDKLRARPESFADHYSQARQFFRSMTDVEQSHIVGAFAFELGNVETVHVQRRMLGHLTLVDHDLGERVAQALGMEGEAEPPTARVPPRDLPPSPSLSLLRKAPKSLFGKKVAIVLTDGSDAALPKQLASELSKLGAKLEVLTPKKAGATLSDGSLVTPFRPLSNAPSLLFDAVVLAPSDAGAQLLLGQAAAIDFVRDAFGHLKAIGYVDSARPLLQKAAVMPDAGVVDVSGGKLDDFLTAAAQHRVWARESTVRTTP